MIVECCSQERSYSQFYGLIGERFCKIGRVWCDNFQEAFAKYYDTIHRYETNKLRNIGRFFGHLLASDAISWAVLHLVHMNEEETTSSSRIFIKILMQEIMEEMGIKQMAARFKEPDLQPALVGIFPKDNPKNTRFSINYFTSIGLGVLTEDMRTWLQVRIGIPASRYPLTFNTTIRMLRRSSWRNGKLHLRPDHRTAIPPTATRLPILIVPILAPTATYLQTLAHRMILATDVDGHQLLTVAAVPDTSASPDHRRHRPGGEGTLQTPDHLRHEGDIRVILGRRPAGDKSRVHHREIIEDGISMDGIDKQWMVYVVDCKSYIRYQIMWHDITGKIVNAQKHNAGTCADGPTSIIKSS